MKIKVFTVIALSIFLSACGQTAPSSVSNPTTAPDKNIFTSIKDAVTKQIALKCEYKDEDSVTTTYIKGQTVRLVGSKDQAGVEGLMKDGKFYLWNSLSDKTKTGMVIDISKLEGAKMGETPVKSIDDVIAELEKKKENCTVSTESDKMFELPTDITFSDAPSLFGATK